MQFFFWDPEKKEKKPEAEKKERSKSKSKRKSTTKGKIRFFTLAPAERRKQERDAPCVSNFLTLLSLILGK